MVVQEEQELGGRVVEPAHASEVSQGVPHVFATRGLTASEGFKRGTKRPMCTFYNLIGHTIYECYRKNGYPPGYRNKEKAVSVNSVQAAPTQTAPAGDSDGDLDSNGGVTISQQQYQSLYVLFQDHSSAASVLDLATRATVSCVTKPYTSDSGSGQVSDVPYVPSAPTRNQASDHPYSSKGSEQFLDDW